MKYRLWDIDTGNRLDRFATEAEALVFVRTMVAAYPRDKLQTLSLTWRDDDDQTGGPVIGEELLQRAEQNAPEQEPVHRNGGHVVAARRGSSGSSGSPMAAASKRSPARPRDNRTRKV